MPRWGFLTNHALVLIPFANHPRSTLREIADAVGITERAALSILRLMEEDAIITRKKEGRRNKYWVDFNTLLDYQLSGPYSVLELVETITDIANRVRALQNESKKATA